MDPVTLLLDEISSKFAGGPPGRAVLEAAAVRLLRFAQSSPPSRADCPEAGPGQEALYELGRHPVSGIALYLVSDAPGIVSAPHEHRTWAVAVGLGGIEVNTLYRIRDAGARTAAPGASRRIGPGDWIVMLEDEVHATESLGPAPTYHLHLYGRALDSLPPFGTRTFRPV